MIRRVALGLFVSLLTLILIEGIASLGVFVWNTRMNFFPPLPDRAHTSYDPELGWVSRKSDVARDAFGPGVDVTTNAQGFRNARDFSREVPDGRTRVVCLGDSFTFGFRVGDGDSWPARLEQVCPRVEAPNMGQSGYGIDQDYLWYLRDGVALDHQVLVLAFIDHDLDRVRHADLLGYGKPVLRVVDGALAVHNVPVPRASYLSPVLTQNLQALGYLRTVELAQKISGRWFPRPPQAERWPLDDEQTGALDEAIILALRDVAAKRGTALVLVHLPHLELSQPSVLAPLSGWARALLDRLAASGIPVIDLSSDFAALPDAERRKLFQERTLEHGAAGHYSPAGNEFVARAVASALTRLELLPPEACR